MTTPAKQVNEVHLPPFLKGLILVALLLLSASCEKLREREEGEMRAFMKAVWEDPDARAALLEIHEIVGERIIAFKISVSDGKIVDCTLDSTGPGRNGHLLPEARRAAEPKFCAAIREIGPYPVREGPGTLAFTIPEAEVQTADAES